MDLPFVGKTMKTFNINKQIILSWIDHNQRIFERGYRYLQRQMLFNITQEKETLRASCHGVENKRYELWVRFEEGSLIDSDCTCPYELECKHIVALLLRWVLTPEEFQEGSPIPE
jgi:uncharacterized Zn finger protein